MTYFGFLLRWAAPSKQTLTWSKIGSVDCFLIIQFDSEVYCDIKKTASPLIRENKLIVKKIIQDAAHSELLPVNSKSLKVCIIFEKYI